ncbi:ATP-dependent DNA ligase [Candidatus Woesebacteria bacterium]|nr:ATP-dependent DNA ligase [Candidatus Woesebacteria bacterium]
MTFQQLSKYIKQIEDTSSRVEITKILADLFEKLNPQEYEYAVYLLQGQVSPKYAVITFGMAEKMVARAVSSAMQIDISDFTKEYKRVGDLGEVAEKLKNENPSFEEQDISIQLVFETLLKLAKASGPGSQDEKTRLLGSLIRQLDSLSSRYIARIPVGALRLGFSDMTILDALSWMITGDKSLRPDLQSAYHVYPDLGHIGRLVKEGGIEAIRHIKPEVFTPIIMMRAERLSSGAEIIDQIGECAIEPKFDGFRIQVHKKGDEVRLYTRGLEDATFMYPDIVEGVRREVTVESAILEGEAIGYDPQAQTFLPFQETVQRKRKHGITEKALEIPLKLFAFELLYVNGKNYVNEPFTTRRKELMAIVSNSGDRATDTVIVADDQVVSDPKLVELMFDDAITKGLEGIVAKKLDGTYQPGARGWNWIKFKRSYSSKIDDTIDCLVLGYDYGKGKRASFGIGAFLVGVYDDKNDQYLTVAKIGTGLRDDEWKELKTKSEKLKTEKKPVGYTIDSMMDCDVWIDASIIVEIKADEITRSPVHTAGRVMKASKSGSSEDVETPGYALRFPRLVRFRDDKSPTEVTTVHELIDMFSLQTTSH